MTNFLTQVLEAIYSVIKSHGWSVVVFTILVRLVLLPLDIKSRKGMRKQQKIQPELNRLQQKYANDRAKLQQKQSELMRKHGFNPLSGCLPLLLQWPILIAMFGAMRAIADAQTVQQVFSFLKGETPVYEGWLWIKNIWAVDSPFAAIVPDLNAIRMINQGVWENAFNALGDANRAGILANIQTLVPDFTGVLDFATREGFQASFPFVQAALSASEAYKATLATMPGWTNINFLLFSVSVYQNFNGLLILPLLAGVTQVIMTKFTPGMQPQQQNGAAGAQTPGMGSFMKYFFPAFTVYICLSSTSAFAIYWIVGNILSSVTGISINKYLDKKEQIEMIQKGENTVQ